MTAVSAPTTGQPSDAVCHIFWWWPCTEEGVGKHMSYADAKAWRDEKPAERWIKLLPA